MVHAADCASGVVANRFRHFHKPTDGSMVLAIAGKAISDVEAPVVCHEKSGSLHPHSLMHSMAPGSATPDVKTVALALLPTGASRPYTPPLKPRPKPRTVLSAPEAFQRLLVFLLAPTGEDDQTSTTSRQSEEIKSICLSTGPVQF